MHRTARLVLYIFLFSFCGIGMADTLPDGVARIGGDRGYAAFGRAVGDRRIVALGEQTHGDAVNFALRVDLVRYLHEQRGFDVLILESGLYDIARLWHDRADTGIDARAPGKVFYMYARAPEFRVLLRYLDEQRRIGRPLVLAGMDAQHSGEASRERLVADLETQLRTRRSTLPDDAGWPAFKAQANRLIAMDRTAPARAGQVAFFRMADAAAAAFCPAAAKPGASTEFPTGPGWWCAIAGSLRAQASSYWLGTAERDVQMAANAQWLLDGPFKGRKAVVWGHNVHLSRRFLDFEGATLSWNAGALLARHYGDTLHAVNFTTDRGQYVDFVTMHDVNVEPAPDGSLEALLAPFSQGRSALLVDAARAPPALQELRIRQLFYLDGTSTVADRDFDSVIHQSVAVPVRFDR